MPADETTIAIMGQDIAARHEQIDIDKLRFLPDNPRVYATIREMSGFEDLTRDEQQLQIYDRLLKEPSVKNLIPEIERDRGLQEPIIVRWDTQEVIEGNSRLAVYRKLNEDATDNQWKSIRCLVVSSLTVEQQTRLFGQIHLHGRTEWSAYAKALFCYRWVVEQGKLVPDLVRLSGFTPTEIKKNVRTIELMQENGDGTFSNFSYYNVLVRSQRISDEIKENRQLRNRLFSQIKTKDFTAQEMRKHLPAVIAKPRILRKYETGNVTLEDAYDRAKTSGTQQRLKRIREWLQEIEDGDLAPLERNELNAVKQVVKQIDRRLKRVIEMVDAKLDANSTDAQANRSTQ